EVGGPVATETKGGKRVEIYSFTQGYSKAARVSRTIGHGAADVFTLGLWEAVGTPTEAAFNGSRVVYEVTYDAADRIENVVLLTKSPPGYLIGWTLRQASHRAPNTLLDGRAHPSVTEEPRRSADSWSRWCD